MIVLLSYGAGRRYTLLSLAVTFSYRACGILKASAFDPPYADHSALDTTSPIHVTSRCLIRGAP
jgi:hypothetical protein